MTAIHEVCKAFTKHAFEYQKVAKVQQEIGMRLVERLAYLARTPCSILDLGCGPGNMTTLLQKKYKNAQIVGLDISPAMLKEAKKNQTWRRKWPLVNGNMLQLPFGSESFDVVFANQALHWALDWKAVLQEVKRVMQKGACLFFSTLGPDTFIELKGSWADKHDHVHPFLDMHDLGDLLLGTRFLDPVVDMEMLTVQYKSVDALLQSLKAQGVRNMHKNRNTGLTGRQAWQQFRESYEKKYVKDGKSVLSYEVIYGHAWKNTTEEKKQHKEVFIPVEAIMKKVKRD